EPEPFDGIPLSWSRAYGGTVRLAPGFLPGSEVPHPGGEVAYPQNPEGMGFILTEDDAHGAPLPNLEDPAALMTKPLDRPIPAGFAPCPRHAGLRPVPNPEAGDVVSALEQTLILKHHAP